MKKNLSILLLALPLLGFGQKFTISGYVSDAETGEKLLSATVFDRKSGQGTLTNTYGFFSLTLPKDSVKLVVSFIGQEPQERNFYLTKNEVLNFKLGAAGTLGEVVIKADRYEKIEERSQMSRIDVPIEQIKKVPALLGEVDVLKALQLLPGVQSGGEGQSGIYVRGGGPDQNLILLDGVPVYNASHLFGFFSVFNADAIRDVNLTKGGFPARYGGRLSSVIEINMKEGNQNEYHGEGSVGLISSKLTFEGPVKKGKSSFIVSGRRTYMDLVFRPLIKAAFSSEEGSSGVAGYYFYDLNAKYNHEFSENDRLFVSFYGGRDEFYANLKESDEFGSSQFENGLDWGNITSAVRWNHVFTPKLFLNTTATFSQYEFGTNIGVEDRDKNPGGQPDDIGKFLLKYRSGIDDWAGRLDFDWRPDPRHDVRFGAHAIRHSFDPGKFKITTVITTENINQDTTVGNPRIPATEFSSWIEDDFKITSRLRVNAGLHFAAFNSKGKTWPSLQPRLNARLLLDGGYAIKASYSTMRQFIHLLTNENIGLPTDLWLPTTDLVKPENSWQAAIGAAKTFKDDYEVSFEAYYKEMNGVIAFKEGESLFSASDWQTRVTQGTGTSHGAEFFVQKKKGRFSGWLGYTLSWNWRKFDDLNFGKRYPYKYDRRHDFEVVASYKFNKRVQLSATWVYGTGNAVTIGESTYYTPGGDRNDFFDRLDLVNIKERNNYRMKSYHRLDWGLDFTKEKKRFTRTWSFGAYNAYSRRNPFFIYQDSSFYQNPDGSYTEEKRFRQVSLFPIIPYISYGFKF